MLKSDSSCKIIFKTNLSYYLTLELLLLDDRKVEEMISKKDYLLN